MDSQNKTHDFFFFFFWTNSVLSSNWCNTTASTYRAAIPQWPPDFFPASMKSERPMRLMVGAMASGPMYLSTKPTSPERPRTSWSREETRMAPWICQSQEKTNTDSDYFCYSVSAFTANLHDSLTITDCFSFPLRHCKRSHKASWTDTYASNKHLGLQTVYFDKCRNANAF